MEIDGNIIHRYPGGIVTVAGSKKKIPATFSRPWQSRVPYPSPKCPFHRPEEREQALLATMPIEGDQWFVLNSLFAPEKPHRLIIPNMCWDDEKMRQLGGNKEIERATDIAEAQLNREDERAGLWGFSAQVGPLAAQNVPHCHYHLYRPMLFKDNLSRDTDSAPTHVTIDDISVNDQVWVSDGDKFQIIAGGQYTGQLYIFPRRNMGIRSLSTVINYLVQIYAEKFRSVEGLAPDYRFEFEICDGAINFGIFVPKLNNTGTLEDMAMIDHRRGANLLWSHEETARYLRS